jgi:YVTN family beta-propeller protein
MFTLREASLALALALALLPFASSEGAPFRVLDSFSVAGDGGWDYLTFDRVANRLFIARSTRVQVVDPKNGHVLGEIPDTPGVHGVALAYDMGKGYASNGRDNSITVFDLASLKTLDRIATPEGRNPDAIIYDPGSKRVLAFNGASHSATVIDTRSDTVAATIALGGAPESAVVDDAGRVFVAIEDRGEVVSLDPVEGGVLQRFVLPGCVEPAGLGIDVSKARLFVGCRNRTMLVIDATDGHVFAQLPIGEGVDATLFDAERRLAFSSQGDGTLTIVQATDDRYSVQQSVTTRRGARTMTIDPNSHHIFVVTSDFDEAVANGSSRPRRTMRPGTFTMMVVGDDAP